MLSHFEKSRKVIKNYYRLGICCWCNSQASVVICFYLSLAHSHSHASCLRILLIQKMGHLWDRVVVCLYVYIAIHVFVCNGLKWGLWTTVVIRHPWCVAAELLLPCQQYSMLYSMEPSRSSWWAILVDRTARKSTSIHWSQSSMN